MMRTLRKETARAIVVGPRGNGVIVGECVHENGRVWMPLGAKTAIERFTEEPKAHGFPMWPVGPGAVRRLQ